MRLATPHYESMSMKALFLLLLASGSALADDGALLRCRTIADTAGRVACYDAIPVGAARPAAATVAAAPAAPLTAQDKERAFGLETVKKVVEKDAPQAIHSNIVGAFGGWGPRQQFKLANGQVWRVVDDSQESLAPINNPKVSVVRNLFGTLFLQIEGTNHSPKVRRVE